MSNAIDPDWTRTRIGGSGAPVGLDTGQRTQTWLAVSDDPAARVTGRYWHHLRQEQPASEARPRDIRRMGYHHKMTGEGSSAKTDFEHALLKSCSLRNKDRCLQTLNQPAIHQVTI
jgi:hypothetical protein